jgi:hypothetical protein
MTTPHDPASVIGAWLDEGPLELPVDTRRAVVVALRTTPQRRGSLASLFREGRSQMLASNSMRFAVALSVISIAAVLGLVLLGRGPAPVIAPAAVSPSPSDASPIESTDAVPASPTSVAATPREFTVETERVRASLVVPAGWTRFMDFAFQKNGAGPPAGVGLGIWHVENVYIDPCKWGQGLHSPQIGPGVEDLADALSQQLGDRSPSRAPTSLDGFTGEVVEYDLPEDISGCDLGEYRSFMIEHSQYPGGIPRIHQGAGQREQLWIIDVRGERVVINASYFPEATSVDRAELQSVVDSIEIELIEAEPTPSGRATTAPSAGDSSSLFPSSLRDASDGYIGPRPLDPGTYVVRASDWEEGWSVPLNVVLTVPDGWQSDGGAPYNGQVLVSKHNGDPPAGMRLGVRSLAESGEARSSEVGVASGCYERSPAIQTRTTYASAQDLARELATLPDSRMAQPVETWVGGHAAWRVDMVMPASVGQCALGFEEPVGVFLGYILPLRAAERIDMRVLDVGGSRLLVDARYFPGTSDEDRAELQSIIDSLIIEPVQTPPAGQPAVTP